MDERPGPAGEGRCVLRPGRLSLLPHHHLRRPRDHVDRRLSGDARPAAERAGGIGRRGRDVACTETAAPRRSATAPDRRPPTGGHSAHLLRAPTLADVLRQQLTPTPRVVTMSMKPRAAMMLAGHAGDAVLWYTPDGGPTTSTAYASERRFPSSPLRADVLDAGGVDRPVEEAAARRRLPDHEDDGSASTRRTDGPTRSRIR